MDLDFFLPKHRPLTHRNPFSPATPFSPPSGPATGSFNGLHAKSKFLAATATLKPDINGQTRGVLIRVATQSSPRQLLYSNRLAAYADQRTLIYAMDSGNSRNPVIIKRIMENTQIAADPGNETPEAR